MTLSPTSALASGRRRSATSLRTRRGSSYLQMCYLTQTWLAVSNDAAATVSGHYWYHRQRQAPAAQARDPAFQDQLMDRLAALTGVALF
jgi:hypothetical protein